MYGVVYWGKILNLLVNRCVKYGNQIFCIHFNGAYHHRNYIVDTIVRVAQSCPLGNQAKFVLRPLKSNNPSKNFIGMEISMGVSTGLNVRDHKACMSQQEMTTQY